MYIKCKLLFKDDISLLPCLAYWNIQRRAVFTRVYTPAEFCLAHSDPVKANKLFNQKLSGSNQKFFFVEKTNIHEKRSINFAKSDFCSLNLVSNEIKIRM